MKTASRRTLLAGVAVAGIGVLGVAGWLIADEFLHVEVAPSLALTDKFRESGYWQLTETPRGHVIQATAGRYRGWYLDADETMEPNVGEEEEDVDNRFLVLSKKVRESCYWRLEQANSGHLIRAAESPFQSHCIDIAGLDKPRETPDYSFARNLLVGPVEFPWELTETEQGAMFQATALDYDGWFLVVDDTVDTVRVWRRSVEERKKEVDRRLNRFEFTGGRIQSTGEIRADVSYSSSRRKRL